MGKSTNTPGKTKFQEKQHVVYPLQGVGRIDSIEEREFQGHTLLYYVIYLDVTDMTVMVPVDKAEELGIRPIVPRKEANRALKLISEEYEPVTADWKMRYQMNLDLLKQGSVTDIATVVRTLYHRSKIKELPILERKLFDSALRLLVDEVSFSLNKPKSEVEQLVFNKLETEHPAKPAAGEQPEQGADSRPGADAAPETESDAEPSVDEDLEEE
ncbi:MAG: CarD family transcriptional regulator [Spirochaetaceae bacterium]